MGNQFGLNITEKEEKNTMRRKMETILWKLRWNVVESFLNDEEGDSNLVAVIVLIVIILAVAAIFRTQLLNAVNAVFEQLTEFIG